MPASQFVLKYDQYSPYSSSSQSMSNHNHNSTMSFSGGSNTTPPSTFKFPPPPSLLPPPTSTSHCVSSPYLLSTSDVETNSDDTSADDYVVIPSHKNSKSHGGGNSSGGAIVSSSSSSSNTTFSQSSVPAPSQPPPTTTTTAVTQQQSTQLPPIGVFWDIENCQVPRGRSALTVAQTIRDKFFDGFREVEFLVVCDVKKENTQIIQELNDAQVNLIHVSSTCKNAADQKLRQSIRRFADIHAAPAAIILISGDVNFASDLSDLRHRKKMHVILIHNDRCSEGLILCASEHHDFTALVSHLPLRGTTNKLVSTGPAEVLVTGLPQGLDHSRIRNRLKRLSENCGGRVGVITDYTTTIRFPSYEFALRAQKRIDQEHVFGNKINVGHPVIVQPSPARNTMHRNSGGGTSSGRRHYNSEGEYTNGGGDHFYAGTGGGGGGCYNGYNNQENIQDPTSNFQLWQSNNYRGNSGNGGARAILGSRGGGALNDHHNANGNVGHYCSSNSKNSIMNHSNSGGGGSGGGGNHSSTTSSSAFPNNSSQPITILKRSSPLPPALSDLSGFSINTSVPPPPIVNLSHASRPHVNGNTLNERYFHPISASSGPSNNSLNISSSSSTQQPLSAPAPPSSPVELHVSNLDQNIDPAKLKRILSACFAEHVMGAHVSVFVQNDGTHAASVKLKSLQDAQYSISQLHRKKIGFKRILISYTHSGAPHSPALIRSQIVSLLQEVPTFKLPLFKFREMFEMRYSVSISVSELYKLKDVCLITEEDGPGRTITLNPDHRTSLTPSPVFRENNSTPLLEQPFCTIHFKMGKQASSVPSGCLVASSGDDKGWAELKASVLPNVKIALKLFAEQVHALIDSHTGVLPLVSFPDCYEAKYGSLPVDETGVALEHLVTCIKDVDLVTNNYAGVKYLRKGDGSSVNVHDDGNSSEVSPCVSPSLQNQMILLCRELVDLIKTFPHCQMVFNKFIPAYHHHFGRQCRVADYGFTKLIDLLESLPHIVQVMGDGSRRIITLSHRAQMRRFTSDLLRTLKSVPNKQCTVSNFPSVFQRVHNRAFDPVDYGLSTLDDLLSIVSENTIVVQPCLDDRTETMIAVPKREQTPEEIERTRKFSREVVEVLSHMPHYTLLFNKFIPSYHHHYGLQCRVSDFGFTKLIELFESIPDVVTIEDDVDDRRLTLTLKEKLSVLIQQIKSLIVIHSPITLDNLNANFSWQFGYPLRPSSYECDSLGQLVAKLEPKIRLDDKCTLIIHEDDLIELKIFRIFVEHSNSKILFSDFVNIYKKIYKQVIRLDDVQNVSNVVKVVRKNSNTFVQLTSIQLFAKDVYHLLYSYDGKISLNNFESSYLKMYGTAVQCAQYGFQSLSSLLGQISAVVSVRDKHKQKILILNRNLSCVGISLPREANNNTSGSSYEKSSSDRKYSMDGAPSNKSRYETSRYGGFDSCNNSSARDRNRSDNNNLYQRKQNECHMNINRYSDDERYHQAVKCSIDSRYRFSSDDSSNMVRNGVVSKGEGGDTGRCSPPGGNSNATSTAGSAGHGASGIGAVAAAPLPFVNLPDFKIHPDTFTCSPLTSPYKGFPCTANITAPHPSALPLPPFQLNL